VTQVSEEEGLLAVSLVRTGNALSGSITLFLTPEPLQLQKWRVVDAQGAVTEVALSGIETGITLSSGLFHYYDPERQKPVYDRK